MSNDVNDKWRQNAAKIAWSLAQRILVERRRTPLTNNDLNADFI